MKSESWLQAAMAQAGSQNSQIPTSTV